MSLFRDAPDHFTRWLFARGILPDAASTDARGEHYVSRPPSAPMGATRSDHDGGGWPARHPPAPRARAVAIWRGGAGWRVALDDGGQHRGRRRGAMPRPSGADPALPGLGGGSGPSGLRRRSLAAGTPWRHRSGRGRADRRYRPHDAGRPWRRSTGPGIAAPSWPYLGAACWRGRRAPSRTASTLSPTRPSPAPRAACSACCGGACAGGRPTSDGRRWWTPSASGCRLWAALPPGEQRRVAAPPAAVLGGPSVPRRAAALRPGRGVAGGGPARRCCGPVSCGLDADAAGLAPLWRAPVTRRAPQLRCRRALHRARQRAAHRPAGRRSRRRAGWPARTASASASRSTPREPHHRLADGAAAGRLWAFGPVTRGSFGEMTGQPDIVRHVARTVPGLLEALAES